MWKCRRCGEIVDMEKFKCGCVVSPSPWEPFTPAEGTALHAKAMIEELKQQAASVAIDAYDKTGTYDKELEKLMRSKSYCSHCYQIIPKGEEANHLGGKCDEICVKCGCPVHPCLPCEEVIQMSNHADSQYFDLLNKILTEGKWKGNRTGVDCSTIAGFMFEHDMAEGFPLLTSRKLPFKSTKVELEFFIKGLSSKKWLQDRGCHYWDGWCNPQLVPYGNDDVTKAKMAAQDDLGTIYGYLWRNWPTNEIDYSAAVLDTNPPQYTYKTIDQLRGIVDTLKKNPSDRRMICSAWNPSVLKTAALPSCHYGFQVTVIDGYLNLAWNQRSCDSYLGIPANISSYALLLHLLAKESGLKEGKLIGFLMDTHLYETHLEQAKELLTRTIYKLPTVNTDKFTSIFEWKYTDTELINYQSGPVLTAPVAI